MDLWPNDISHTDISNFPGQILNQQAHLLGEKTKNLVSAEVLQDTVRKKDSFKFSFYITSSVTGGYRFWVFSIFHDIHFYPLELELDSDIFRDLDEDEGSYTSRYVASSQDEFFEILRKIFSSKKTKQVISSLLAMARIGTKPEPSEVIADDDFGENPDCPF